MRIVFYSSNSNVWEEGSLITKCFPSWTEQWADFCKENTQNEYFFVIQKPALFMPTQSSDFFDSPIVLSPQTNAKDFANEILNLQPDLAIACTYWVSPYDWLPVKDSLIGEYLQANNIKTICHTSKTSYICFDKNRCHQELEKHNFNVAKAVYVHHDMYFCAGSHTEVEENVYKEYIAAQIQKLKLPLIIKDTLGLSSFGMTVVHTYPEAIGYLNSKRNNSDRIVEEFIQGIQFGTEIHGCQGNYKVFPPFAFSVNQYGITSPKQSIKMGPVMDPKYKIDELNKELLRLAEVLELNGVAQVDLIFSNDKWFIIEINPRLSGMTQTYLSAFNKKSNNFEFVKSIKLNNQTEEQLEEIKKQPDVIFVSQTENHKAVQEREKGYCEVISRISKEELDNFLSTL